MRDGVAGRRTSSNAMASAMAFAMQTGVLILFPSPKPFAPNGVKGLGDSIWIIVGTGISQAVGNR